MKNRITQGELAFLRSGQHVLSQTAVVPECPIRVLISAADSKDQSVLKKDLESMSRPDFVVTWLDAKAALAHLSRNSPDVVLLDLNLSEEADLAFFRKATQLAGITPIILLTESDDKDLCIAAMKEGAQDCLIKMRINAEVISRCICYSIERVRFDQARLRTTAIQDFCSTLAHDLRAPLSGSKDVLGAVLANRLGELTDNQIEALTLVQDTTTRVQEMIGRLLHVYQYETSPEVLHVEDILLSECLDSSMDKLEILIKEFNAHFVLDLTTTPTKVRADKIALQHVLLNLISNAVKFGRAESPIEIRAEVLQSSVVIQVKNYGKPISPEQLENLFYRFWQGEPGKSYVASIGLGLYLSKRIIALHGGNIWCTSSEAEGTIFFVELPAAV